MDCGISVLVMGDVLSEGTGTAEPSTLRFVHADGPEDAGALIERAAVDAILLDSEDIEAIGSLTTLAADLPILALDRKHCIDVARNAIAEGADDVLLPRDLVDETLRRRVAIAIARKGVDMRRLRLAREDALTGLANGTLLEERFARALARADRSATLVGSVAIDLDGFDEVIARHGRDFADRLLSMAGQRLLAETRRTDTLARTRDHGFTWLVEDLPSIHDVSALVDRLPACLAAPFTIDDRAIRLTASVGVAVCPFHGRDFATVQGMAEAAMLDVASINGDGLLMPPLPPAPKPTRTQALL